MVPQHTGLSSIIFIFRCVLESLYEVMSVRRMDGPLVRYPFLLVTLLALRPSQLAPRLMQLDPSAAASSQLVLIKTENFLVVVP